MRLGLQVPNFTWSKDQGQLGDTFATIAERAERAGLYSLWVMDHFLQNVADLEAFELLATRVVPEVEKIKVAGR